MSERALPNVLANSQTWKFVFPAVPLFNLAFQFCSEKLAKATVGMPLNGAWLAAVLADPWTLALVGFEILSFGAWMFVLSRAPLSAAFPLTAIIYVLVILLGWTVFHETASPLQAAAAIVIMVGVYLLGSSEESSQ